MTTPVDFPKCKMCSYKDNFFLKNFVVIFSGVALTQLEQNTLNADEKNILTEFSNFVNGFTGTN